MGFPKQQQNGRSGMTLLALLDLTPEDSWKKAKAHLIGITPMMEFFEKIMVKDMLQIAEKASGDKPSINFYKQR